MKGWKNINIEQIKMQNKCEPIQFKANAKQLIFFQIMTG